MRKYELSINGKHYEVHVRKFNSEEATLRVNGRTFTVKVNEVVDSRSRLQRARSVAPLAGRASPLSGAALALASNDRKTVLAPIPGQVLEILVKPGDAVKSGALLLKMEAMKMENQIRSETAGVVREVKVARGDAVAQGQELVILD
jgi:glutaconyl-CoA/methylmalonyl-CoA decarboxylase subunit gamma